jgi:hypothetical protein
MMLAVFKCFVNIKSKAFPIALEDKEPKTIIEMETPSQQHDENKAAAQQERPRLNSLNWLNLVFYIGNTVFTYGVGVLGWFGNASNDVLSEKYQVRERNALIILLMRDLETAKHNPSIFLTISSFLTLLL